MRYERPAEVRAGQIGIDLVPFSRVTTLLTSGAGVALSRMLSAEEIRLSYRSDVPDIPGIAGRLAAKEAVFKLFHARGHTLPWLSTEILRGAGGWPEVRLSGRAARLARESGIDEVAVSIAHDEPCAIAVALATGPHDPPQVPNTLNGEVPQPSAALADRPTSV